MPTPLPHLIQALDDKRCGLLDELDSWPLESLQARAQPGRWSALETVEHLILAERVILQGLPDPSLLVARPRGLKHRCIYGLVLFILKSGIPVKVPSRRMLPTGKASLGELRGQWDEHLSWLRAYVAGLDPAALLPAVFLHPVAGPITLAQALRLDHLHLDTHCRQIQRLRPLGKGRPA